MAESMITKSSKPKPIRPNSEVAEFNFAEIIFDKDKLPKKRVNSKGKAITPDKKSSASRDDRDNSSSASVTSVTKNSLSTSIASEENSSNTVTNLSTQEHSCIKKADKVEVSRAELDIFKTEIRNMLSSLFENSSSENRKRRHAGGSKQTSPASASDSTRSYYGQYDSEDESEDNESLGDFTQTHFKIPKLSDHSGKDIISQIDDILDDKTTSTTGQGNGNDADGVQAQDFEDSLIKEYVVSTTVGKAVNDKVAPIIEGFFSSHGTSERLAALIDKYPRPENVKVFTPLVNYEIWRVLKQNTRVQELKMAKTSEKLTKESYAIIIALNELLSLKKNMTENQKELSDIIKTVLDGLTLLGSTALDFHQKRKDAFRHDSNLRYSNLICCPGSNADVGSSEYLFGADVVKKIKDIKDSTQNFSTAGSSNPVKQFQE